MNLARDAESARSLLDELLSMLVDQGGDEETSFGVHLFIEEMLLLRRKPGRTYQR